MQTVTIETFVWSVVAALVVGAIIGAIVGVWMNWPIDLGDKRKGGDAL